MRLPIHSTQTQEPAIGLVRADNETLFRVLVLCLCLLLCQAVFPPSAYAQWRVPQLVYRLTYSQKRQRPTKPSISPAYFPLWHEALSSDEVDLQRQAAISIAIAQQEGYLDCRKFENLLQARLSAPGISADVRVDFARALTAIHPHSIHPEVVRWLGSSRLYDEMIEPMLAIFLRDKNTTNFGAFNHGEKWRSTLKNQHLRSWRRSLSARCLGILGRAQDDDVLLGVIQDSKSPSQVRMEAARAFRDFSSFNRGHSVEEIKASQVRIARVAEKLGKNRDLTSQLLAALMISRIHNEQTETLMKDFAVRFAPTAAAIALQFFEDIAPESELPNWKPDAPELVALAETNIRHQDATLRQYAIRSLCKSPTEQRLRSVFDRLQDRHPDVRRWATLCLREAYEKNANLRSVIISHTHNRLGSLEWRAAEQAAILLGEIDHTASATKLIAALAHNESEVKTAAAWSLRVLSSKDVADQVLAYAQNIDRRLLRRQVTFGEDEQLAHLFETLAVLNDRRAIPLVRTYAKKDAQRFVMPEARSAAAWALGQFFKDTKDADVARFLGERLTDVMNTSSELFTVRFASAVALGEIKSPTAIKDLESQVGRAEDEISMACRQAIARIQGRKMQLPEPRRTSRASWFLQPLPNRRRVLSIEEINKSSRLPESPRTDVNDSKQ